MSWIKGKKYPQMRRTVENLGIYAKKGFYEKRDVSGIGHGFNRKHTEESKIKMSLSKLGKPSKLKGIPQINKRGENAAHWKGGKLRRTAVYRSRIEWKIWREKVFIRDSWTCQKCGARCVALHPHHLVAVKELVGKNDDMIFNVSNGLTLCVPCHREVHRKRG
jgi:5-methylcytosine-specific restriction endonuclease McrA